jgi:lipopolysaccharide transport system permease protein
MTGTMRRGIYVRDLLRELVGRDIKLRYKRSVLGIGWSLLNPLAHLVVLVFVFQRVAPLNIPDYPLFVFTGVLAWRWFTTGLSGATTSITGNRELIRQPGFPPAILPAVPVLSSLVHFAIAAGLVLLALAIGGRGLSMAVLALPLVVALQFVVILSLGYVTATAQVRFRDTTDVVGVVLLLGFFLTPVFYRPGLLPPTYQALYVINPMAHLINAYRDVLISQRWPNVADLSVVGVAAMVLLWLSKQMFDHASVKFAEET